MTAERVCLQGGSSLAVSLILLVAIMLLGAVTARITVQGEKAARNERDFRAAFYAAEAALRDAQDDIDDDGRSESLFLPVEQGAFLQGCGRKSDGLSHGLCAMTASGNAPAWLTVDLTDREMATARTVPYGMYTGRRFAAGEGSLPASLPRYLIELLAFAPEVPSDDGTVHAVYRITAIGFGMRESTHVVLQAVYRRERTTDSFSEAETGERYRYRSRRVSWREIPHWQELHDERRKK